MTRTAKSKETHRRYFQIGGMTICVESDLPITENTFHPKFKCFECKGSGEETVLLRHHFSIPDLSGWHFGERIYQKPPWAVYRQEDAWIYLGIYKNNQSRNFHRVGVLTPDHTQADIYHHDETKKAFQKGGLVSLSLFPTDQIILARVLADRQGCFMHSGGVILENNGLLFVGHSDAGKSTMVNMLKQEAEILCDDRIIIRHQTNGYRIFGTWSHGDVTQVSSASAPLKAVLFLKQSRHNHLIRLDNQQVILHRLLACLIKPLLTADWWNNILTLVPHIAATVPCYTLEFDKSGRVVELLRHI